MSILMFILDPKNDSERLFSVPLLTEAAFNEIVFPVAERIAAQMVCHLGTGFDVGLSEANDLEAELNDVVNNLPQTEIVEQYITPRIYNLVSKMRQIFKTRADIVLFIG